MRDEGKVVKCNRCGKWHLKRDRCPICSSSKKSSVKTKASPTKSKGLFYVYVIECRTPKHHYIGFTTNLERRITQHNTGTGSEFTKIHGVKRVVETFYYHTEEDALEAEEKITRQYMRKFGVSNVAGGSIAQLSDKSRKMARRKESPVYKAAKTMEKIAKPKPFSQVILGKKSYKSSKRSRSKKKSKKPRTYQSCSTCVHAQSCSNWNKRKNKDNDCENHVHYSAQEGLELR
jgi:putative endonuclease